MRGHVKFIIGAILLAVLGGGVLMFSQARQSRATAPLEEIQESFASHAYAADLGELVHGSASFRGADLVVRGRAITAVNRQVPRPSLPTPEPGSRKFMPPNHDSWVDFTLEISEVVLAGQAPPTAPIIVTTPGYQQDGKAYFMEGYRHLQLGQEYLLFLIQRPDGRFEPVGPQGYLKVQGNKVEPLQLGLPAIEDLRGKPVEEVKRQVKAAKVPKRQ